MKHVLWIVSALLALTFLFIGGTKVFTPAVELESMSQGVPVVLLKIAGMAEMLGAIGLVLPAATRILPVMTPIAASGLVVTMIGATIANIVIGEYALVGQTITLGVLAAFVGWARFGRFAVAPRQTAAMAT